MDFDYISLYFSEDVISALQELDTDTLNHLLRVGNLAIEVEQFLEFENHDLSKAAFLFDIGKKYLSKTILEKTGSLSDLEKKLINLHPYFSYCILKDLALPEEICMISLLHGSLSPETLAPIDEYKGDKKYIEKRASIIKTLDVYCALTESRSYRKELTAIEAIQFLVENEQEYDSDTLVFLKYNNNLLV